MIQTTLTELHTEWKSLQPLKNEDQLRLNRKFMLEFLDSASEHDIARKFNEIKEKYGRDVFGQGYIYRLIEDDEIAKTDGIESSKKHYVVYDKGDKDGNRWYLDTPFAIDWSKENVGVLKKNTKARYQGYKFYFKEGFCWTDVNSTYLKARIKAKGVFDVLSMTLFTQTDLPDWYFVCIINSEFMSFYVDNFINNTSHFQINDARQVPIIIPTDQQLADIKVIYDASLALKKKQFQTADVQKIAELEEQLNELQHKLDSYVLKLYGLD